ncbi:MAG: DUF6263 family protein [Armatimonadota bacterium]
MKKTVFLLVILSCLVFALSSCTTGPKEISLCYNLSKGDILNYDIEIENTMTMNIPIKGMETSPSVTMNMKADYTQRVFDIDKDGNITMEGEITIKEAAMKQGDKVKPVPLKEKDKKPVKFRMKMNKYGKTLEFNAEEGDNKFLKINDMMNNISGFAPEHPIKVGQTWKKNQKIEFPVKGINPMTVDYNMDYIFEKIEKFNDTNCALITINGTFDEQLAPKDKKEELKREDFDVTVNGKLNGKIYWGIKRGIPVKMDTGLAMQSSLSAKDKKGETQTFSMDMDMNIIMTLRK